MALKSLLERPLALKKLIYKKVDKIVVSNLI